MNLVSNSIDAMKDMNGRRELAIKSQRAENEHLMVSVSDTGVGLPPLQADQIFTAFFTTKIHGTGMDYPSAAPSSSRIAADCGPPTTLRAAPVFTSFCPAKSRHTIDAFPGYARFAHRFCSKCTPPPLSPRGAGAYGPKAAESIFSERSKRVPAAQIRTSRARPPGKLSRHRTGGSPSTPDRRGEIAWERHIPLWDSSLWSPPQRPSIAIRRRCSAPPEILGRPGRISWPIKRKSISIL